MAPLAEVITMNRWVSSLNAFLAAIALTGCVHRVLEAKDIWSFQVNRINSSSIEIRLSGLVSHSSLGVDKISTQQIDESLQVLVYLTLATKEKSGNLNYTLVIPDSVNEVVFGNDKTVIWTRQQ